MIVAQKQSFGDRLKALREAAQLSPYQLAKKAGLSGQAITMLEDGARRPTWDTVLKLARALEVAVGEFDVGDEPGQPEDANTEEPVAPLSVTPPPKKPKKPKK